MRGAAMMGSILLIAGMAAAQQVTPPPPAPPRPANLPKPAEKALANGMRVIVVPKHDVPLVSARLMIRTGSEADPGDLAGLASLTANLLTQGTTTRTAEQIARGVEALGATLNANAAWDASNVNITVMSSRLDPALTFVADVVRNPVFKEDEVQRLREQSIDAVRVALQDPLSIARYVAARVVFEDRPYGHAATGTPESLGRIARDQVIAFHKRHYRPNNAVLIIAGDVKPDAAFAAAEKLFGSWKSAPVEIANSAEKADSADAKPRVIVVDMPDAGQAAVLVTRRGLRRADPQYYAALVANSVLGGGYSARLNQEIRIKRGLSYGASSTFDLRRAAGPFAAYTQTKNESAAEVAGIIIDELDRLGAGELGDSELTPRKAVLVGGFGRALETTAGIVERVASLALHDLPLTDINSYIPGVQAVTGEAVRKFAASQLPGGSANIIIVGDADQFVEALRKRFGTVEVIPMEELDLESTVLRREKKAA
jgi:zinc protease